MVNVYAEGLLWTIYLDTPSEPLRWRLLCSVLI